MSAPARTALVTGSNRGIGRAVAEALARAGHRVVAAAREASDAEATARALGGDARPLALDLARLESVEAALARLAAEAIHVDVLVNDAGLYGEGDALGAPVAAFRLAMEIHLFGPLRLAQALVPPMRAARWGRVVNVSSGAGSFGEGLSGPAAYCVSKAALDALTVKLAEVAGPHVKVNAVCPGWVRTRMGGEGAPRSIEEGAAGVIWAATLPDDGPTGGFFRDGKPIAW